MIALEELLTGLNLDQLWYGPWDDHRPIVARLNCAVGEMARAEVTDVDYTLRIGVLIGAAIAAGEVVSFAAAAQEAGAAIDRELLVPA